jgi:hypothetical protein
MRLATRKAINDTSCIDALDDLLCSIRKVSRPEQNQEEKLVEYNSNRQEVEKAYQASVFYIPKMTTARMVVDLATLGVFTSYLYK